MFQMTMPSAPTQPQFAPAPVDLRQRTLTLEDLTRLSREASPWEFLPVVDQAIAQAPGDVRLALLGVRTLASLGLRTPAIDRLDALGSRIEAAPGAAELRQAIEALPGDEVPLTRRLKMAERNLAALNGRGLDLTDQFNAWRQGEDRWQHLRALDGNIVRRPAGSRGSLHWRWVGDLRKGMAAFVEQSLDGIDAARCPQLAVEGVGPPWLLKAMHQRTGRSAFGYAPRLTILQADACEFFEGLSVADLRACLSDDRVRCFVGADATRRFRDGCLARMDEQLGGIGMTCATVRTRCDPALTTTITEITNAQRAETERAQERVEQIYAPLDAGCWANRFGAALNPENDEPLRVLIPSCRYTTWVRHAAESLRDALERMGCRAETLIEPNDHANLSELAYHRRIETFRPDLVVILNYTRAGRGRTIPKNVPFVCWTQDGMGHLFDGAAGAGQGDLDFVVGHVYEALLSRFGFRRDRALRFPVAADGQTFTPTDFSIAESPKFDSELAYVSHHSEPPVARLERLIREDGDGRFEGMLRAIDRRIEDLLAHADRSPFRVPLWRAVEEEVDCALPGADRSGIVARVNHQFAIPLAERRVRHQMIRWAAAIAARRGWRFALYGVGWDEHPEFTEFARGPVEHGAALRDCYERSAVHLHASVCNPAHQRVQECAMAGGLPLSRITRDALQVEFELMRLGVMGRIEPAARDETLGLVGFRVAEDPDLMAIAAQLQRLGMWDADSPDPALLWIESIEWRRRTTATATPMIDTRTRWLFGDYAQCAFTDERGLERLTARALERPQWRRAVSGAIDRRVRDRLVIDQVARRILEFVNDGLNDGLERNRP